MLIDLLSVGKVLSTSINKRFRLTFILPCKVNVNIQVWMMYLVNFYMVYFDSAGC